MQKYLQGSETSSLFFLMKLQNKNFLFLLSISIILGMCYVFTLAPNITWANNGSDGGDLITAAATQGIAHASGYPLYLIFARLFQALPLGSLAYRTNLMSAVFMVLSALMLFSLTKRLMSELPYKNLAAWTTAIVYGITPLVWSQAVITEVYGLQALLTTLILWQSLAKQESKWMDISRGLVFGLALGNHLTTILLLPIFFRDGIETWCNLRKHLGGRLIGLIIGSLVYLTLPIWAMGKPPVNWGNPITWSAFFELVTGQIYQTNFTLIYVLDRLRGLAGIFIKQFGLIGLFIGVFHLSKYWQNRRIHAPLVYVFIISILFALVYGSFDSHVYLIPAIMVFSIWIGLGLQEIIQLTVARWHAGLLLICLMLVSILAFQVTKVAPEVDASKDTRAQVFGEQIMKTLPDRTLVITRDDETTFTLWYFHYGLKQRSDLVVVAEGLLNYEWYVETLKYTYPDLQIPQGEKITSASLITTNSTRPGCVIHDHTSTELECSNPGSAVGK